MNKISVVCDEKVLELSIPCDTNIEEWGDIFKTILTFLTFSPELIDSLILEEDQGGGSLKLSFGQITQDYSKFYEGEIGLEVDSQPETIESYGGEGDLGDGESADEFGIQLDDFSIYPLTKKTMCILGEKIVNHVMACGADAQFILTENGPKLKIKS